VSILDELDPQVKTNALPFHCDRHPKFWADCDDCNRAKVAYWHKRVGKKPEPILVKSPSSLADFIKGAPTNDRKQMATAGTNSRPNKVVPIAAARLTDSQSSHLAAAKIPSKTLWERMITIRNLVLAHPGHCIRFYVNTLAEQIPAPELHAPGCRDSAGVPKHDVGFYGVWATLFAQAEKHGLIVKMHDPTMPTEKLMRRSPYPGESMVHVYEACTAANVQRMESERKAYFERVEAQKAANGEAKAPAVAERQLAKKDAKSVRHEIEAPLGTDAEQSGSWFQML
jgi:hypothetical protein